MARQRTAKFSSRHWTFVLVFMVPVLVSCLGPNIPSVAKLEAVIVDMPHGWWRVQVYPDGSGAYAFGALPEMGGIEADTFNFDRIYSELSTRIIKDPGSMEEGSTVQFCVKGQGCGDLFFFDDHEFADELFDRAFENRTGDPTLLGDTAHLDKLWMERENR